MNAVARANASAEKATQLEAQLAEALHAGHQSNTAMLSAQLRQLADGVRALEQGFKTSCSAAGLGEVELPPCGEASDELYLLPCMRVLGSCLEVLDGALRQVVELSSRELTTEAVEFMLASLWSRIPGVPLEEVQQGIVPGYEREARGLVRGLAADIVATFIPKAGDGPAV